ncbi:hypothetical protein GCM10010145_06540 [Streptomyces ruber]|uniref:DUF1648 domain-containing protein n=2 Tax=Streptomyces TaxID=1883 RepID=A0A918B7E4_9ACTN|nr:DUF1648 domain-containing protein [Streptomyces ruber]GGQ41063.1 hypothetical protein GCM10010145_06540 [Streptomyces ruber]
MVFSAPVRLWLLPSAVLLAALTVWGALRYPHLPDRIPEHIGPAEVDAWTDRSIGSAFLLVLLYAGLTVLMAGSAELALRMTPRDELPETTGLSSSLVNRPATRASARRTARALLLLNACIGVSFAVGCGVLWRSTPDPDVPAWLPVAALVPIVVGAVPTIVVAMRDRKR